jgi:NAD(P)H-dependent FMN reductase
LALRILSLCGSLRAVSVNRARLRAAAALAPSGALVVPFEGIGELPHFNADLDREPGPPPVEAFRAALRDAGAVLISAPEYAHGVPGSLKNALDWLVGSGELLEKPVALLSGSPRAAHASAALREILTVMTARLVAEACVTLDLPTNRLDGAALLADPTTREALRAAVAALAAAAAAPG